MSDETMNDSFEELDPNDKEVRLAESLEHLRIMLSVEMKDLRDRRGISQVQLGEDLNVQQPWISKVENAQSNTGIESILRYLFALDAQLVLGILDEDNFLPVTEAAENWWEAITNKTCRLSEKPDAHHAKVISLAESSKSPRQSTVKTNQISLREMQVVG